MADPAASMGLTPHNYNYLKCWSTLVVDGKEVFQHIFLWGFQRPPSGIKEALFHLPNYSNSKYRSDFDASQRRKLEAGDVDNFDLNLFYLLLQRVCHLPHPSEKVWGREGDVDSLPNILYQIKMKRNTLAHTNIEITEIEMLKQIDELKSLFNKALDLASNIFHTSKEEWKRVKERINLHILSVQGSNVAISQQSLKQIAEEKVALARNEAQADLVMAYKHFSKVLLAPWTITENFQNINDVFTEPILKQTTKNVLSQQMSEEESTVQVENILTSKLPDGTYPNFIILLSSSGMGKTTLIKYIIQSWIERNAHIFGIEYIDLILYMDCRVSKANSFEDFISTLIPNALNIFSKHEMKVLIMTMQVLVILDNVDEICEEALPTYEELLNLNSDNFRILATSSQNLSRTLIKRCHQKHLKLQLEGISHMKISSCISKMYASLYGSETTSSKEEVDMFVSEYISKAHLHSAEAVRSPEILSHIFFHWLMQSKKESFCTTKTQLFLTTHELLCLKLLEKAGTHTQTKLLDQKIFYDSLNLFFDEVFRISFQTVGKNETELSSSTFNELLSICKTLGLPHSILKEVLVIKEKQTNLPLKIQVSATFPSKSLQIFYCAMHIVNMLTSEQSFNLESIGDTFFETLIRRSSFLSLMKFIIGILAQNDVLKLENSIKAIFFIITKFCPTCGSSFWLEISEEARCHATVMRTARNQMGDSWVLEDQEISSGLITMLQNYPPKQLNLTLSTPLEDAYFLRKALEVGSSIPEISLSLHLYHNFWVNKKQTCDSYLKILQQNKKLNVESFAGKLSSEYLLRMPNSLKKLALHIKPEDITILNTSLEKLKNLIMLYINLDMDVSFPAIRVPRLKLPSTNILLYVDVWNTEERNISWTCDAIHSFSPGYSRLALRKTNLGYDSTKLLLEGFRYRRVHVDTLVIGTTKSITKEQENSLLELANSFECGEVKVIQL